MSCRLCKQDLILEESHIIPKFIYRWIKQTSLTGGIRDNKKPNLRKQDGTVVPFLCSQCEDLFCDFETYFAKKIFFPVINNKLTEITVNDKLIGFAISLLWRCLKYRVESKSQIEDLTAKELGKFNEFIGCCEAYFLNKDLTRINSYKIHVIPLTESMEDEGIIPKLTSTNQRGTCTSYRAFCKEQEGYDYLAFYVKIPYFLFIAEVIPNSKYTWRNSDVLHDTVVLNQNNVMINNLVREIIKTSYENKMITGRNISSKQMNGIKETSKQAIKKGLNSNQNKSIEAKVREHDYMSNS